MKQWWLAAHVGWWHISLVWYISGPINVKCNFLNFRLCYYIVCTFATSYCYYHCYTLYIFITANKYQRIMRRKSFRYSVTSCRKTWLSANHKTLCNRMTSTYYCTFKLCVHVLLVLGDEYIYIYPDYILKYVTGI